jgi:hypothetical protein
MSWSKRGRFTMIWCFFNLHLLIDCLIVRGCSQKREVWVALLWLSCKIINKIYLARNLCVISWHWRYASNCKLITILGFAWHGVWGRTTADTGSEVKPGLTLSSTSWGTKGVRLWNLEPGPLNSFLATSKRIFRFFWDSVMLPALNCYG